MSVKMATPGLLKDLIRKTTFFEGWSGFKLNNLGLALGMALKFYILNRVKEISLL